MRVAAIEGWTIAVPLPEPVQLGSSVLREREYVVLRVHADTGQTGCAWSMTRGLPVLQAAERLVADHAVGADVSRTAAIWAAVVRATSTAGSASVVMRALSLVDIALWDLKATGADLPLHRLLGGLSERVPVMAICGYPSPGRSAEAVGARMAELLGSGYPLVKVPRWPDPAATSAILRTASRAGATADRIVVDAAWAWRDAHAALSEIRRWDVAPLAWLEDPFVATRTGDYRRLHRACPHPLGVGDEVHDADVVAELAVTEVIDVMRLDATVSGGVTGAWRAMDFAGQLGVPVSLHVHAPIHLHLAAAHPACISIEAFDEPDARFDPEHRMLATSSPLVGGFASLPERPGLGCEVDLDFVTRHAREHVRAEGGLG